MSTASEIFDIDFKYLILFTVMMFVIYLSVDKTSIKSPNQQEQIKEKTKAESRKTKEIVIEDTQKEPIKAEIESDDLKKTRTINLTSTSKGECFNNQFSSDKGAIKINGSSFYTNWREVKFKYCVESDNKHYLVAETYGNKAVGYLVFDDIDKPRNIDNYGCVLHNEFKIIKQNPADFLPVDCSKKGLERLASNSP